MAFKYPGGIETIAIADTAAFDTAAAEDASAFVVEIPRKNIAKEGTDFPDPEGVTAALADDREGRLGVNQSVSIRATGMPIADFETLEAACDDQAEVYIRVDSMKTDGQGAPAVVTTYKRVILSNVVPGPVRADRSAYGVIVIDGMCTGFTSSDLFDLVHNDPA